MKDVEIITALECCSNMGGECGFCPLKNRSSTDCNNYLAGNALELINRQKAMINRLEEREHLHRKEAIVEFVEKLKEGFNSLEYNPNTCRKTFDIDVVKSQMDWILHEVTSKEIDRVVKEMVGEDNA